MRARHFFFPTWERGNNWRWVRDALLDSAAYWRWVQYSSLNDKWRTRHFSCELELRGTNPETDFIPSFSDYGPQVPRSVPGRCEPVWYNLNSVETLRSPLPAGLSTAESPMAPIHLCPLNVWRNRYAYALEYNSLMFRRTWTRTYDFTKVFFNSKK